MLLKDSVAFTLGAFHLEISRLPPQEAACFPESIFSLQQRVSEMGSSQFVCLCVVYRSERRRAVDRADSIEPFGTFSALDQAGDSELNQRRHVHDQS